MTASAVQNLPGLITSSSTNKVFSSQPKTIGGLSYNSGLNKSLKNNDSSLRISAVNKLNDKVDVNNYDLAAGSFFDNPGEPDSLSYKLYDATASVFNFLLKDWLDVIDNSDEFAKNIKISKDCVVTVNRSITQLKELQRNQNGMKIDNLLKNFYYMFDINHMSKRDNDKSKIKDKLNEMKLTIEYDSSTKPIGECEKSELSGYVKNLKNIVIKCEHKSRNLNFIMVTNELMKGMMLLNESNNEYLKKMINALSKDYLEEVKSNQYQIISSKIDENHVKLMSNVMPIFFGILYQHILLLTKFKERILNEDEKKKIKHLNKFISNSMNIFINRFIIFGNKSEKELSNLQNIRALLAKMDGNNTEESNSNIITPEFLELTDKSISEVLGLVEETNVDNWKNTFVFKLNYDELVKQENNDFMQLLTNNSYLLYSLLGAFESQFLEGIEYKDNNINN